MRFCEALIKYRQRKGMTQYEVAKAVKVTTVTINRYEHERSEPSISKAREIARVLGFSLDDLDVYYFRPKRRPMPRPDYPPRKGKPNVNKGKAITKNRRGDHWDDVRIMCKEGKTQKEIQDALGLTWTEARNAILSLKREGVI